MFNECLLVELMYLKTQVKAGKEVDPVREPII